MSDEELYTVLFAMLRHRTPRKAAKKTRGKDGIHLICSQMTHLRGHVTKYLTPSEDNEGHFEHAMLSACAVESYEEFNTAVAKITSRFPPGGRPRESPVEQINKALTDLIANAERLYAQGAMPPGLNAQLVENGIQTLLQLLNGRPEVVPQSSGPSPEESNTNTQSRLAVVEEQVISSDSSESYMRAGKRQKVGPVEYKEVYPVDAQQSYGGYPVDPQVAHMAQTWSFAPPDLDFWSEVMASAETAAFSVDPDCVSIPTKQ
jgi:hypothetical protein